MSNLLKLNRAAWCALAFALALVAGMVLAPGAWAAVGPGVYTASVSASYENPDDGSIVDAGGQSNVTLGQSMVEGVSYPEALIESDGAAEYVTVRFGQAGNIDDVRVAADPEHDGTFGAEAPCERVRESDDGKTADYRFEAEDDGATFMFSLYVEPMGRDVSFFITLSDPVEGNSAGFEQTASIAPSRESQSPEADAEPSGQAAEAGEGSAAADTAEGAASSDAATSDVADTAASDAVPAGDADGLNVPLIVAIVVVCVVIIALVAYFAAIRPGKQAAKRAAEEAAKRERLKRS